MLSITPVCSMHEYQHGGDQNAAIVSSGKTRPEIYVTEF